MSSKAILAQHDKNMERTVEVLRNELRSLRGGRASPGLVEHLMVEYYGTPTPLRQLATIACPEPASLVIKPFDVSCIKDIEKAIRASELSLAPVVESKMIRLNIPPLSEERRKQIVNQVKQLGERSKVSIRNIRRDAIKQLDDEEDAKRITEDDRDKGKKEADDMTKKYADQVDHIVKAKSDEVMTN
ncbi:MAG: ribosome recycling factor [Planctomycetes bacterium]|nr:ribosome recycling factor [Planctomycetota bacterium]